MPLSAAAVVVEDLVVRYGDRVAVDRASFSVAPGDVLALLGRNGAGKTSTVEALEGYRRAYSGSVRVLGLDPSQPDGRRALAARVGVMLQQGGIYPSMSPREALRLFASYYRDPEDPAELLERLGLCEVARTAFRRLSGGEQQRLSLALALVGRPQVAFLDEPTSGVDPQGRQAIRDEVQRLRDKGSAVVLTTHELPEAERLADRVCIMHRGRIVAAGSLDELASSVGPTRFRSRPGLDVMALGATIGMRVTEESPGSYVTDGQADPRQVASLAAWLAQAGAALEDLRSGRESLEQAFLRLTQESDHESDPGPVGRARLHGAQLR